MRKFSISIALLGAFGLSGCSMCSPGYLQDYAGVGGKWQRSDPTHGRVGSVFSDPGANSPLGAEEVWSESESYLPPVEDAYDQEWEDGSIGGSISDMQADDDAIFLEEGQ